MTIKEGASRRRSGKTAARDREIYDRWIKRETQQAIADSLGITQQSVNDAIKRERDSAGPEQKAELRQRWLGLYEEFTDRLYAIASTGPIPAYSNGRPIGAAFDEDGKITEYAQDYSGVVKAMDAARAMSESARKMMGIDAPARAEVESTVKFEVVGIDTKDLQ